MEENKYKKEKVRCMVLQEETGNKGDLFLYENEKTGKFEKILGCFHYKNRKCSIKGVDDCKGRDNDRYTDDLCEFAREPQSLIED